MGKEQELLEAARSGNVVLIEKILSPKNKWTGPIPLPLVQNLLKGPHPNCQDASGGTPLHYAALNDHKEVVEVLLRLQASSNIPDQKGCYPLHLASWRGNAEICKVLLSHGPSYAKVNAQNLEGDTALHSAAQYGHNGVVNVLLQKAADPTIKNVKDERALDLAILYGRLETVQLLLGATGARAYVVGPDDKSPLHLAAKNGNRQVAQLLLETGFDVNYKTESGSALHEASVYGRLDVAKLLLERGIDVNLKDCVDKTALDLLNDLKTPASTELRKTICDHINALNSKSNPTPKVLIKADDDDEADYDFVPNNRPVLPDSLSATSRESVTSLDSSVFENNCIFAGTAEEENIYDLPPAGIRVAAIKSSSGSNTLSLSSSFNKNDVQNRPDTPKKPPRRRPPQTVAMVKGEDPKKKKVPTATLR